MILVKNALFCAFYRGSIFLVSNHGYWRTNGDNTMKNIWLKPHQIDWKSKLVFLVSTFTVSAAFNVATSNHDQLAYPDPNTEFPAFFGYSLSVTDPDTNQ